MLSTLSAGRRGGAKCSGKKAGCGATMVAFAVAVAVAFAGRLLCVRGDDGGPLTYPLGAPLR
jgi:hypothetical protein